MVRDERDRAERGLPPSASTTSYAQQALATLRAIVVIHRREEAVRREYSPALNALVLAKEHADGLSHVSGDIDRTADEIIKHAHELSEECIWDDQDERCVAVFNSMIYRRDTHSHPY